MSDKIRGQVRYQNDSFDHLDKEIVLHASFVEYSTSVMRSMVNESLHNSMEN